MLSSVWLASAGDGQGSDREPSRFAARRNKPGCSNNHNLRELSGLLRTGTVRGPGSLLQPWGGWERGGSSGRSAGLGGGGYWRVSGLGGRKWPATAKRVVFAGNASFPAVCDGFEGFSLIRWNSVTLPNRWRSHAGRTGDSPETRRRLPVVPLIGDKRYYGETTGRLRGDSRRIRRTGWCGRWRTVRSKRLGFHAAKPPQSPQNQCDEPGDRIKVVARDGELEFLALPGLLIAQGLIVAHFFWAMSMEAKMSSRLFRGSSFFGLRVWRR